MPTVISNSQELVYHARGPREHDNVLVRKVEKECWQRLFGKYKKVSEILYELNTKWLPNDCKFELVNPRDPEDMVRKCRKILEEYGSAFDLKLIVREEETIDAVATSSPPTLLTQHLQAV